MSAGLSIGIPTGTLLADSCALITQAGVAPLDAASFAQVLRAQMGTHEFFRIRPTDVPTYVGMGACDIGIVGKDVLWETEQEVYELVDLGFGPCRLVLAAPRNSQMAQGAWPKGLRVGTKYPSATRRFLDEQGVPAELLKLHGSVELAPLTGLVDAVTDLTVTGRTLAANDLVEVTEINRSTARLIVNQASLKTRFEIVMSVVSALRDAVAAQVHAAP